MKTIVDYDIDGGRYKTKLQSLIQDEIEFYEELRELREENG